MEEDAVCFGSLLESGHHLALFVGFRISSAHQHDASGCAWVEFQCTLVEVALGNAFEQVYQVALDA